MKSINKLLNYINDKYDETDKEMDAINGKPNINRHTRYTMSSYVENAVAILIEDILSKKNKNYNYMIDAQLSVDKKTKRPDILIYKDNVIYGVVEIKSQLGYSGEFNKNNSYNKRIASIKNGKKIVLKRREVTDEIFRLGNEINNLEKKKSKNDELIKSKKKEKSELLKKEQVPYSISPEFQDFVVILMTSNSHRNLPKFKGTNYYVLFHDDDETVWYSNLDERFLTNNETATGLLKGHTYDDLVDYLEKNF